MENLLQMFSLMRAENVNSNIFPVTYNHRGFSCILLRQDYGCTFYISTLGDPSETIAIDINPPFDSPVKLAREEYYVLANYLGFTGATGNVFYPQAFFNEFDTHITPALNRPATTQEHARSVGRSVSLKEGDGTLFCGWRNNGNSGHVTDKNYGKTRKLVGEARALELRKANISSRWTNNTNDENLARLNEYLHFIGD